ncbi:MAG: ribonuclease HII [Treponema sp.]|nr:ribonuclease HII [Treponema sp.]
MGSELFETPRVLRAGDFLSLPPGGSGVCGIDEAGRGPLAGPVFAAAVVLPEDFPLGILGDSKALSPARRESAFAVILERSLAWAIEWASSAEIDELNILGASLLAMRRAYLALGREADRVYVDGNRFPDLGRPCWPVIKGDAILPAVMAASILAKVARDRAMVRFDWLYPEYGYARHKGYPTAEHRALCRRLGPSPIQRLSFRYDR